MTTEQIEEVQELHDALPPMRGWNLEEAFAHVGERAVTPTGKVRVIGSVTKNRETGDMELGILCLKRKVGDPLWINLTPGRIVAWKLQDTGKYCGVLLEE